MKKSVLSSMVIYGLLLYSTSYGMESVEGGRYYNCYCSFTPEDLKDDNNVNTAFLNLQMISGNLPAGGFFDFLNDKEKRNWETQIEIVMKSVRRRYQLSKLLKEFVCSMPFTRGRIVNQEETWGGIETIITTTAIGNIQNNKEISENANTITTEGNQSGNNKIRKKRKLWSNKIQERTQETAQETAQETMQETARETTQETAQETTQETAQETVNYDEIDGGKKGKKKKRNTKASSSNEGDTVTGTENNQQFKVADSQEGKSNKRKLKSKK